MDTLYPLCFNPIFRRYLWGGRRLETVLGKTIGEGDDYAESWEIVDHGEDQSVVANGRLQGATLHELVCEHGRALFGRHNLQQQFPLLFKFLDCNRNLSVQVHPNDAQAKQLDPPDLGKTEAWVVLHAEPGAVLYAGLKRGFDRQAFEREIHRGTTELCLNKIEPHVGDCIFIPAGTVHALGAGLVVAEIQQASDTTYRIFDWNRLDSDGKPRPLHIEAALEVIDFDAGPVCPQQPSRIDVCSEQLVACDKFVLKRWKLSAPTAFFADDAFHILALLEGSMDIRSDSSVSSLSRGQTAVIPAICRGVQFEPHDNVVFLDMHLP